MLIVLMGMLWVGREMFLQHARCTYCDGFKWKHEDSCPWAIAFNEDDPTD